MASAGSLDSLFRQAAASGRGRQGALLRFRLERRLMGALKRGGLDAMGRLVAGLNRRGRALVLDVEQANLRRWTEPLPRRRTLSLQAFAADGMFSVSVMVGRAPPPLTRAQRRKDELQKRFYARYEDAARRSFAGGRLAPADLTVLLVGELEADVNNGGFSQYLDNKGRRRALQALRALRSVGARRTAAALERALARPGDEALLSGLDEAFYRSAEDLALLCVRRLGLSR